MDISVLICTFNRCESLKDTLDSLLNQINVDHVEYEVIVVDNHSTDDTKAVIESYLEKVNGRLRYLYEGKRGKPYALNHGISIARGKIIAFTDDDCIVDKDYLNKIWKTFSQYDGNISFLGGKINIEWWNCSRPDWMSDYFLPILARLDYGNTPFIIDGKKEKRNIYGANYAFRTELFNKHGLFKPERVYTQDIEIVQRMLKSGEKGLYAPEVKVRHKVTPNRIRKKYFYHWHYKKGKMRILDEGIAKKAHYPLGVPIWILRQTVINFVKSFFQRNEFDSMIFRCRSFSNAGLISEIMKRNII